MRENIDAPLSSTDTKNRSTKSPETNSRSKFTRSCLFLCAFYCQLPHRLQRNSLVRSIVRFFHRLRSPKRQVAVYLFSSSLFACFHIQRLFSSISSARKTNTAPSTKKTKSRQKIKKLFLWKCVNHLRANGEFDGKVFFFSFRTGHLLNA